LTEAKLAYLTQLQRASSPPQSSTSNKNIDPIHTYPTQDTGIARFRGNVRQAIIDAGIDTARTISATVAT
jgi:hypothetical protein